MTGNLVPCESSYSLIKRRNNPSRRNHCRDDDDCSYDDDVPVMVHVAQYHRPHDWRHYSNRHCNCGAPSPDWIYELEATIFGSQEIHKQSFRLRP